MESTKSLTKIFLSIFIIASLYFTFGYTYSEYVFANEMDNAESVKAACAFYPSSFICNQEAELAFLSKNYAEAIRLTSRILDQQPNQFLALKIRADSYLQTNNLISACKDYKAYNGLFDGTSSVSEIIAKNCITKN